MTDSAYLESLSDTEPLSVYGPPVIEITFSAWVKPGGPRGYQAVVNLGLCSLGPDFAAGYDTHAITDVTELVFSPGLLGLPFGSVQAVPQLRLFYPRLLSHPQVFCDAQASALVNLFGGGPAPRARIAALISEAVQVIGLYERTEGQHNYQAMFRFAFRGNSAAYAYYQLMLDLRHAACRMAGHAFNPMEQLAPYHQYWEEIIADMRRRHPGPDAFNLYAGNKLGIEGDIYYWACNQSRAVGALERHLRVGVV